MLRSMPKDRQDKTALPAAAAKPAKNSPTSWDDRLFPLSKTTLKRLMRVVKRQQGPEY
jgi:hypothetical protein